MSVVKRSVAELLGTFWLVFGGCGSAVLAAAFPEVGIGLVGVSLAFGLTVVTMAYAVGPHLRRPLQSRGDARAAGRRARQGRRRAALHRRAGDRRGARRRGAGVHRRAATAPTRSRADSRPTASAIIRRVTTRRASAFVTEVLMTFFFLLIILGVTDGRAPAGFAPLAIGLALTLIHSISIPVTNTSVNPARSTGPALLVGGWALSQLWLFWVAPIAGAMVGGRAAQAALREVREPRRCSTPSAATSGRGRSRLPRGRPACHCDPVNRSGARATPCRPARSRPRAGP